MVFSVFCSKCGAPVERRNIDVLAVCFHCKKKNRARNNARYALERAIKEKNGPRIEYLEKRIVELS